MDARWLLASVLVRPERIRGISLGDWDLLIRQGRSAYLLARLHVLLDERGLLEQVPERPRWHLEGARIVADQQHAAVVREVAAIRKALVGTGSPIVYLKGAAYVLAGLPAARGRTLSDIDILVSKATLPDVEADLMFAGWATGNIDAYDERYYRTWMHEIPPMRHLKRGTTIDVHHAILPETARIRADTQRMRSAAVGIPGYGDVYVFSPADMVLHSATHLFHEGELDKGLRDLVDIDLLLRDFSEQSAGFWDAIARSRTRGRPHASALLRPALRGKNPRDSGAGSRAHRFAGRSAVAPAALADGRAVPSRVATEPRNLLRLADALRASGAVHSRPLAADADAAVAPTPRAQGLDAREGCRGAAVTSMKSERVRIALALGGGGWSRALDSEVATLRI